MKTVLRSLIPFIFLLIIYDNPVCQDLSQANSLRTKLHIAEDDTSKIQILFQLGDLFIDGPSDSLLFYYNGGLEIIRYNLNKLNADKEADINLYKTFKQYELRALIEFGIEYFFHSNYKLALDYFFDALKIAEELDDKSIISECYSEIGIVYKNQGKYDLALEYNEKAMILAEQENDTSWIAVCYANHGTIYLKKGYYTLALDYYIKALKTFEELRHDRRMGACYLNIGKIYSEQADYDKALEYFERALQISDKTGDKVSRTDCFLNIGKVYSDLGDYLLSRSYFNNALSLYDELGYRHEMDECYKNIGTTFKIERNFQKALEFYNKALQISTQEDDMPCMAKIYGHLANVAFLQENYDDALDQATFSMEVANRSGNLTARKNALQFLSEIYEKLGYTTKALYYYKKFTLLNDSLFNENKYKAIREVETKYETEKKEQQLALLQEKNQVQSLKLSRRNRVFLASLIVVLLVFIIGYILFRNYQLKAKQKSINLEQKMLRSQMNPHFIFNSLIAIQSYIYKNDPVQAGDFLAKFADLVRIILEGSRVEFVKLEKEIKMLNLYFELQNLRFENKFDYKIEIGDDIDTENISIPPMLAQPFIENAIEHGLRHKKEKGYLFVTFKKVNDCISLIVEDNGVGRKKATEIEKDKKHKSLAMAITEERLEIFRKRFKKKFLLNITDIVDDSGNPAGTKVILEIPCKQS